MSEHSPVERWLPIPGWEGYYEASDCGRLRSVDRVVRDRRTPNGTRKIRGRVLRTELAAGYERVTFIRDNRPVPISVHVTVLTTFKGVAPSGTICCHENGRKTDNHLTNLYWGTPQDNGNDMKRHGTDWHVNKTSCPRQHVYAGPNLVLTSNRVKGGGRNPSRECRACRSTSGRRSYLRRTGRDMTDEEFNLHADSVYARLMVDYVAER